MAESDATRTGADVSEGRYPDAHGSRRVRPAAVFGLGAALLAGLVTAAPAHTAHAGASARPTAPLASVPWPNTTCCGQD